VCYYGQQEYGVIAKCYVIVWQQWLAIDTDWGEVGVQTSATLPHFERCIQNFTAYCADTV